MSTYTPIASQTLGSAASSVTFSSIPQGYTDLVLVSSMKATGAQYGRIAVGNGTIDTNNNYSQTVLANNYGSYRYSNTGMIYNYVDSTLSTSNYNISITHLMNYSNTTTYKTILNRGNEASGSVEASVGLWRSTAAINIIKIYVTGDNFASGSTFSLYGIQVGDKAQKAQGGNIVTSDGTYVYHTFTSSGSFTPSQALTVDYLVVAGGGSGGYSGANPNGGGGGGAGGMRCTVTGTGGSGSLESPLSLSSGKSYPVIIGAGGAGGSGVANGNNSVFATITSTGGGSGANWTAPYITMNGNAGGSGGGATGGSGATPYGSGGAASPSGQGYAGGSSGGSAGSSASGGGGGGASAVGTDGSGGTGGSGGNGRATSISGSSVTYAGGGASTGTSSNGSAGTGGGGTVGSAGTANTGGGGGGSSTGNSGSGGSGIVIIRYAL